MPSKQADEFIAQLYPAALAASRETGMSWQLMLAQAAQETGWGKKSWKKPIIFSTSRQMRAGMAQAKHLMSGKKTPKQDKQSGKTMLFEHTQITKRLSRIEPCS